MKKKLIEIKNAKYLYRKSFRLLEEKKTRKKGIRLLQESASLGYRDAQLELALEAIVGHFKMEKKEMISSLVDFSNENNPKALLSLGYCYDQGLGVKKNRKKAFELYKKAATLGSPDAQKINSVYLCR